jgi:hypothetical protein
MKGKGRSKKERKEKERKWKIGYVSFRGPFVYIHNP